MKIAFFVNDVMTEQSGYSTIRMAMAATNRGHTAWLIGAENFDCDVDHTIHALAYGAPKKKYTTTAAYLADVQSKRAVRENIVVDDLDILMLRNDPSTDTGHRSWAQSIGITFGQVALQKGVVVLNDPRALQIAANKMYFQMFPEDVRPKTLISQNHKDIRAFIKELGGNAVLKPLQGSGGSGVFLVKLEDKSNLNQMLDSLTQDGYIIVQEYLPAASEGDTRLFMMNGKPLRYRGKYAAFRRVRSGDDMRSNIHAGGKLRQAEIGPSHLKLAEIVRPKLVQDGMFLVGLDIVGDKLMEINVFSPGGLGSAQKFEKVDFTLAVLNALERKTGYMQDYHRKFSNKEIASL